MVTIFPPYSGWEAKLEHEKQKRRVVQRFSFERMRQEGATLSQLQDLCDEHGLTIKETKNGYDILA
jgi:hypothetical protein